MGAITIFTVPRAFEGEVGDRQRNAIQSWLLSGYRVILCGDDAGVDEAARTLGTDHLPGIARNKWGTPLLSDLFAQAQRRLAGRLALYVNTDIMLDDSLALAVKLAGDRFERFLVIGQRHDAIVDGPFDFGEGWQDRLRLLADPNRLHGQFGLDYFGFRSPLWRDVPPLAVGRMRWDNWLLYHATMTGVETIDATLSVLAVHQNHGYEHIVDNMAEWYQNPEIRRNLELAGNCVMGTNSTGWRLVDGEVCAR